MHHKMPSWGVSEKTFSLRCHKANAVNFQATYGNAIYLNIQMQITYSLLKKLNLNKSINN